MYRYFDTHSHLEGSVPSDTLRLENLRVCDFEVQIPQSGYFTAGIHPYDIGNFSKKWLEVLEEVLQSERCVAVGECGVDSTIEDTQKQSRIFSEQCHLAQRHNLPIIIHSVKSQGEVLRALKGITTPKIFHSYTKASPTMLQDPTIYFSLSPRNIRAAHKIPLNKTLLESDEQCDISIAELYNEIAKIHQIPPPELVNIIKETFYKIFKI